MIVRRLTLHDFRIHHSTEMEFSPKLNFIVGGNGQGKTSLIEAIYFLCTTKNYKGAPDTDLLRFGQPGYTVHGVFEDATENNVHIRFLADENRRIYIKDGKTVHRAADIIGAFPVVLLTPEDHALTQGAPADRRKFIDSVISQYSSVYLDNILEYAKVLKQRTFLLNRIKENPGRSLTAELDAFTEKMILTGSAVIRQRDEFLQEFKSFVEEVYQEIMREEESPSMHYQFLEGAAPESDISALFRQKIYARRDDEIRRGMNLTGPHRDDIDFGINGKSLKSFGSQGQHKTFQVALRFAQFFYLKQRSGKTPVFLLDDVFGELDAHRAGHISRYLRQVGQAIITMTDLSNYAYLREMNESRMFTVSAGTVTPA
ncbi:MAG: DNA replication/repair protein RecF [Ignavibacteriaceae bacterium]|nr:DNA replication/repair protein RecF [Ignavibacteriaceae bacterium]